MNIANELEHRLTLPTDGDLDDFKSGVEEVDNYFRNRVWFNNEKGKASPPTYTFLDQGGNRVGYAAFSFGKYPHPHDQSQIKEKYLVIYVAGVDTRFQGVLCPQSGETFAGTVFNTLVRFAREKNGCVGLSLWVRDDNARAIAFYKKLGFSEDENGPVARDDEAAHLTMRLLFD